MYVGLFSASALPSLFTMKEKVHASIQDFSVISQYHWLLNKPLISATNLNPRSHHKQLPFNALKVQIRNLLHFS